MRCRNITLAQTIVMRGPASHPHYKVRHAKSIDIAAFAINQKHVANVANDQRTGRLAKNTLLPN